MPEQQKIDETIETARSLKKKSLKIEQSSTSLENQQNSASEVGSEDDANSILETQDDELKDN
jgi:hypothetical protein